MIRALTPESHFSLPKSIQSRATSPPQAPQDVSRAETSRFAGVMSQGIGLRGVVVLDGFAFVLRSRLVLDDGVVLDVEPARTRNANPRLAVSL